MNGKINKDGDLEIERNKTFRKQFCPYTNMSKQSMAEYGANECGDWCSLFEEPKRIALNNNDTRFFKLSVCKKKLIFDKFTDERS